jgi:hypothetical protein
MKRALYFILILAGCCTAFAAEPDWVLTPDGLGPVKFGMSAKQLQNVLLQKLEYDYDPFHKHACGTVSTKRSQAQGISFTLDNGHVTRISVDFYGKGLRSPVRTEAGIGLDATVEEVKQAYGARLVVKPHPNDPSWQYLVVNSPDHSRAVIFETNGTKVIHIRAGDYPEITQPDGCV